MNRIAAALMFCCGVPAIMLSFFLTYLTLQHIHATDLMWFVFIIMVPVMFVGMIASKIVEFGD